MAGDKKFRGGTVRRYHGFAVGGGGAEDSRGDFNAYAEMVVSHVSGGIDNGEDCRNRGVQSKKCMGKP